MQQPLISDDYITSASHILQAVASFLCLDRMVSLHQQELHVQIDEYIQSHYTEQIDAMSICNEFQIGKTQLYEISKQNSGVGIAEHIRNLRIEKAKLLLKDKNLPLSEIASQCGFKDYNYFITVFKHFAVFSPARTSHGSSPRADRAPQTAASVPQTSEGFANPKSRLGEQFVQLCGK